MYGLGVAKGMWVTLKHFFQTYRFGKDPFRGKAIFTTQYPDERLALPERFRGRPVWLRNQETGKAACTACGYCQPCPSGVEIPKVIAALNKAAIWDDPDQWLTGYARVEGKASGCTECAQCEEICPQGLPIRELMKEAVKVFGQ